MKRFFFRKNIRESLSENKNFQTLRERGGLAGLEGLNPARVPSWLSEGEWAEPGMVPGPSAHSQLCPRPAIGSLHHATQEHGTHPVTRAHRHRQGKVTGRQEVGTETQKGIMTGGRLHELAGSESCSERQRRWKKKQLLRWCLVQYR